ncbi:MAG: hypothetical protein ABSH36_06870 [Solirubrobacteraceae bacterium]
MRIHSIARRSLSLISAALLAALCIGASATAAESNTIEGVWSFNGGSIAIAPLPDGTFQGVVDTETTFAECPHPAEQVAWTGMKQQPDGSFWGYDAWFIRNRSSGECKEDPHLGPTAWRVLSQPNGDHYLKVCFSHPETSQPKIAPDGTATEDTYGCVESALIAPLPTVSGSGSGGGSTGGISYSGTVTLPPSTQCTLQKSLTIKLHDPKYDPLTEVLVKINGKKVADVKGVKLIKKGVKLTKLPTSGSYTVNVVVTTILKQHLSGRSTYTSCTKGSGKIKLHRRGKKHH